MQQNDSLADGYRRVDPLDEGLVRAVSTVVAAVNDYVATDLASAGSKSNSDRLMSANALSVVLKTDLAASVVAAAESSRAGTMTSAALQSQLSFMEAQYTPSRLAGMVQETVDDGSFLSGTIGAPVVPPTHNVSNGSNGTNVSEAAADGGGGGSSGRTVVVVESAVPVVVTEIGGTSTLTMVVIAGLGLFCVVLLVLVICMACWLRRRLKADTVRKQRRRPYDPNHSTDWEDEDDRGVHDQHGRRRERGHEVRGGEAAQQKEKRTRRKRSDKDSTIGRGGGATTARVGSGASGFGFAGRGADANPLANESWVGGLSGDSRYKQGGKSGKSSKADGGGGGGARGETSSREGGGRKGRRGPTVKSGGPRYIGP